MRLAYLARKPGLGLASFGVSPPWFAAVFKLRVVERRRNPNKGEAARTYLRVGSHDVVMQVSALSEARRLGLGDIEAILVTNKASADVALQ